MVTCFIGVGSNLGDRQYNINTAIKKIKVMPSTRITKISRMIETVPQGGPAQGLYLNGAIKISTELSPYQLLKELQAIETALGRVRTVVNGPRQIDLDILTYGDLCMNEEALCIPHPRMLTRDFVLIPLKEIASDIAGPMLKNKSAPIKKKPLLKGAAANLKKRKKKA